MVLIRGFVSSFKSSIFFPRLEGKYLEAVILIIAAFYFWIFNDGLILEERVKAYIHSKIV